MKFWGCGYNANGILGLGNKNNPIYYFTEQDLGDRYIVKGGWFGTTANVLNVYLMDDGFLYAVGGNTGDTSSIHTNIFKVFDSVKLTDIAINNDSTYTNTEVFGTDGRFLYIINITFDSVNDVYNSSYIVVDDTNYQWSQIGNILSIACEIRGTSYSNTSSGEPLGRGGTVSILTNNRLYVTSVGQGVGKTNFAVPTIYELPAQMVKVINAPFEYGTFGYSQKTDFMLDTDGHLYGWGSNRFSQLGTDATVPTKISDVKFKSFATENGTCVGVDIDGNLMVWGRNANYWEIVSTDLHATTESYFDLTPVATGFKNAWIKSSHDENNMSYTIFAQKDDGTLYTCGYASSSQTGLGSTANVYGLTKTSNKPYGEVNLWGVYSSVVLAEYAKSVTIKVYNNTGTEQVAEINATNDIKNIAVGGVLPAPLSAIDVDNKTYKTTIDIKTDRRFIGLAYTPNQAYADLPVGSNTVLINNDLNFYVVLGPFVPREGMTINCYFSSSEPNRVDKTEFITPVVNIKGTLRESCSLTKPAITFELDSVPDFNYVYIEAFKRYYFVEQFESVNLGLWRMYLKCDVLYTYNSYIYGLKDAIVDRNASPTNQNSLLADPYVRVQENPIIETVEGNAIFDTNPLNKCVVLTTVQKSIHYE